MYQITLSQQVCWIWNLQGAWGRFLCHAPFLILRQYKCSRVEIILSWGNVYKCVGTEESPIPSTHSHHCTWRDQWAGIQGKGMLYFDYVYLSTNSDCRLLQAQAGGCGLEERWTGAMSWVGCLLHCAQALRSRDMSHCRLLSVFFLLDDDKIIQTFQEF